MSFGFGYILFAHVLCMGSGQFSASSSEIEATVRSYIRFPEAKSLFFCVSSVFHTNEQTQTCLTCQKNAFWSELIDFILILSIS